MFESKPLNVEELKECIVTKTVVLENGEVREFDLIDFFLMSKDDYIAFLNKVEPLCNKTERSIIKTFFYPLNRKKLCVLEFTTPTVLARIKYTYKNYSLSSEEKKEIISFLQEKNIPISETTYFCAAKKYINEVIKNKGNRKGKTLKKELKHTKENVKGCV